MKIYLKYSSGVFQVLLHLKFTWTSSYLNLVQVNLPEFFLHTLCTYFLCFWNFNVSARLVMSNSAHFLHFLFRSNSSHFLHFFPLKFRSFLAFFVPLKFRSFLAFFFIDSAHSGQIPLIPVISCIFWAEFERTPRLGYASAACSIIRASEIVIRDSLIVKGTYRNDGFCVLGNSQSRRENYIRVPTKLVSNC